MQMKTLTEIFSEGNLGKCPEGCGFIFRTLDYENLEYFLEVRNSVSKNLHDNRTFTLAQAQNWFRNLSNVKYILCYSNLDEVKIGYFRFEFITHDNLQVGLDLHPLNQGMGLGTSLYKCLINHWNLLDTTRKLSLRVLSNNYVAKKLYLNNGFKVKLINSFCQENVILEECYMELELLDK
jgi:RimJ/RimL family protein N-acetyltransferase